jgi:endoglucanase
MAGWLIPSALSLSDSQAMMHIKVNKIVAGFLANLEANTIRLPINTPTVLVGDWWKKYTGSIIGTARYRCGMNVIICAWVQRGTWMDELTT